MSEPEGGPVRPIPGHEGRGPSGASGDAAKLAQGDVLTVEQWHVVARTFRLSGREMEVATLVLRDMKENEIAERLKISPHTVHTYLERLFRKVSVASRTQLVIRVLSVILCGELDETSAG